MEKVCSAQICVQVLGRVCIVCNAYPLLSAGDLTNPGALTPPPSSCIADPPFVTSDHLFSHLSPVRVPTKQHCTPGASTLPAVF